MDARVLLKSWWELRQALSAAGFRMVIDKPAFGQGPGTFYAKLGYYYRPGDDGWRPRYENAHNYFVQVAAETGILGLAGFLWWVGTLMVWGFTRALIEDRPRTRLLAIGVGGGLSLYGACPTPPGALGAGAPLLGLFGHSKGMLASRSGPSDCFSSCVMRHK